jgi:hypothetical protein
VQDPKDRRQGPWLALSLCGSYIKRWLSTGLFYLSTPGCLWGSTLLYRGFLILVHSGKIVKHFFGYWIQQLKLQFYIVDLEVILSILPLFKQVIKDRKWKELQVAFNFPHTTTSAAYVLRKYYIGLLHHYEQVYFLGTQGPLVPPPSRLHTLGAPRCMTKYQ